MILYSHPKYRQQQFFVATEWPGGIYASPTLAGSRPGGKLFHFSLFFVGINNIIQKLFRIDCCLLGFNDVLRSKWLCRSYKEDCGNSSIYRKRVRFAYFFIGFDNWNRFVPRLRQINGIRVMGHPEACIVAVDSTEFNIYRVSDGMAKKGWSLSPLQFPSRYVKVYCRRVLGHYLSLL